MKKGGTIFRHTFPKAYWLFFPQNGNGDLGVVIGKLTGLELGGATLFGVLAASASYIAAPAAIGISMPEANPTLYLTSSLAITFPFNITLGIPLYLAMARAVY